MWQNVNAISNAHDPKGLELIDDFGGIECAGMILEPSRLMLRERDLYCFSSRRHDDPRFTLAINGPSVEHRIVF